MKRSDFIKSLGLGASDIIIPNNTLLNYQAIKIYENYIRGLQHYKYDKIQKELKEGERLLLKRDPDSLYDKFAIQIYYKEFK